MVDDSTTLERDDVVAMTELLRHGVAPFWERLRSEVAARGVDVPTAALAESFEAGPRREVGVVVASPDRVYHYEFSYENAGPAHGRIVEWNDLSRSWANSEYAGAVELAVELFAERAL